MGDKESFPGLPREAAEGELEEFRESLVAGSADGEDELEECILSLGERTLDPGDTTDQHAEQLVRSIVEDLGTKAIDSASDTRRWIKAFELALDVVLTG